MTVREDILAIMRATGQPLRARDIAMVLTEHLGTPVTTNKVAAELSKLGKEGIVAKKTVCLGEPRQYGVYAFPEGGSTTVWFTRESYSPAKMRKVRHYARMFKQLPKPRFPPGPQATTDDMRQMIEDIQRANSSLA